MNWETRINLYKHFFTESEKPLAEVAGLKATAFQYSTGVHALRLVNDRGQITVLPFQGQQIWHCEFYERTLTMKSMFEEPNPTTQFLHTYGGFMVHCGATAMGVPSKDDTHPSHGELPNAPYQSAELLIGEDERGVYMGVTGSYQYTVAFNHKYIARPLVKFYANSSTFPIAITIQNLKQTPMELMYLAHANFRPVDNGKLVYSAPCDVQHVRVRNSLPSHVPAVPGYREYLQDLTEDPTRHNVLTPGQMYDPEVVFYVDYKVDEAGWAHSMQIHPDGSADFISHRPDELDHSIRWISRTPDQDCLGIILPATAEPEGYLAEKAKGNIKVIPPRGEFKCHLEVGYLPPAEAQKMADKIGQILS